MVPRLWGLQDLPNWAVRPSMPPPYDALVMIFAMTPLHFNDPERIPNEPERKRMMNFANATNSPDWLRRVPLRCLLGETSYTPLAHPTVPHSQWESHTPLCAPRLRHGL